LQVVPEVGLEPTHLAVLDFESSASTNSTTRAHQSGDAGRLTNPARRRQAGRLRPSALCQRPTAQVVSGRHPRRGASTRRLTMPDGASTAHLYRPKLATVLREGYGLDAMRLSCGALRIDLWMRN
jgi:hypothetical protein